jgi:hypothetical protein
MTEAQQHQEDMGIGGARRVKPISCRIRCVLSARSKGVWLKQQLLITSKHTRVISACFGIRTTGRLCVLLAIAHLNKGWSVRVIMWGVIQMDGLLTLGITGLRSAN